jgi:prepilin-type processing-associated H-X9-DG protein
MKASLISKPSETVVIGEKITSSYHYHLDLDEIEPNGTVGNDLWQLERSRHGGNGPKTGTGGSNYSFADGSVRFIKYADALWPVNLWAAEDANRVRYAVKPPGAP